MLAPRSLILRAPGTNCDHETAHAFERAGAIARRVHVRALAQRPALVDDYQILCIPGGFSYGDDIASGRIFALELRTRLADTLRGFRDRGGLILGICNGFQVLLQTGLLLADPATGAARASLAHNESGLFTDRWVPLRATPGRCVFLQGMDRFELPVAHGEGRFVTRSSADFAAFEAAGQLVLRYDATAAGGTANPNGAEGDVAGACDETGRIFGLMPHPERFIDAVQHPAWNGHLDPGSAGAGLPLFANAIRAVSS
ncbi:MAG: phosphoribosylformylglycinamidine synthase subunit PurQ [Planctomycetia bacterium]|nr:phosphoribosylformylglycinamidine synthase subunit PurQ [Planctomycetia bacterium]